MANRSKISYKGIELKILANSNNFLNFQICGRKNRVLSRQCFKNPTNIQIISNTTINPYMSGKIRKSSKREKNPQQTLKIRTAGHLLLRLSPTETFSVHSTVIHWAHTALMRNGFVIRISYKKCLCPPRKMFTNALRLLKVSSK